MAIALSSSSDATKTAMTDEHEPLLGEQSAGKAIIVPTDDEVLLIGGESLEAQDKKSTTRSLVKYLIFGLIGVAILGLFIKGFIDAKDVDVGC